MLNAELKPAATLFETYPSALKSKPDFGEFRLRRAQSSRRALEGYRTPKSQLNIQSALARGKPRAATAE